uniref:Uncharacterized protein n=1 Tax=Tanacetum cinerariifolium TaxID=118510 RepID=A0A6L2L5F2_TANCI|nr:hypothetical protein [Tanacetum cinerariifolium]
MAIFVISVYSDSSEDSVGTPTGHVILIDTIPTIIPNTTLSMTSPTTHIDTTPIPTVSPTIPPSPDYTPALLDYSPASDTEFDPFEDPLSDHIPPLPATLRFLSSIDDSLGSDIPDTPPSPTHGTPFTETTLFTQRKRVRPMPTHRLTVRHSVDYSYSNQFSSNDSSSSSSSSSSSKNSLDSFADALSDSASSRSSFDHSLPASSSGTRPSHHLCSLVLSTHRSSTDFKRPSHDSSLSPSRKRRSPAAFVSLSSPIPKPYLIHMLIFYHNIRGLGVLFKAIDREEIETGMRGPIKVRVDRVTHPVVANDILEPAQEGAIQVRYKTLRDLVQRLHDHIEETPVHRVQAIQELEQDNRRLRDMIDVESKRVTRSRRREFYLQRELRQILSFRFYDHIRIASLEYYVRRHLGYRS